MAECRSFHLRLTDYAFASALGWESPPRSLLTALLFWILLHPNLSSLTAQLPNWNWSCGFLDDQN